MVSSLVSSIVWSSSTARLTILPHPGHVCPEAAVGGPIALVQDGDMIHIDAVENSISMDVSDEEIARRKKSWTAPAPKVTQGTLYKYTKLVSDASKGCGTYLARLDRRLLAESHLLVTVTDL